MQRLPQDRPRLRQQEHPGLSRSREGIKDEEDKDFFLPWGSLQPTQAEISFIELDKAVVHGIRSLSFL